MNGPKNELQTHLFRRIVDRLLFEHHTERGKQFCLFS